MCFFFIYASFSFPSAPFPLSLLLQVMETKNMLYLVTEYAKSGEIFGEWYVQKKDQRNLYIVQHKDFDWFYVSENATK